MSLLAFALAAAATKAASQHWTIEQKKDPITDEAQTSLLLKEQGRAILFSCNRSDERGLGAVIISEQYLGGKGGRPFMREVIFRFDDGRPLRATWAYSDHYIVAMSDEIALLHLMEGAKRLVIRATDYQGGNVDLTYDVTGGAAEIAKFRKACKAAGHSF